MVHENIHLNFLFHIWQLLLWPLALGIVAAAFGFVYELGGDVVASTGANQGNGLNGVYTSATTVNVSVSNCKSVKSGTIRWDWVYVQPSMG